MNEATLKEARILMVDDDVSSTCLMTNFLNRIGYSQLQSINDSSRTFEAIETFTPDLILLDLAMPNIDGFQVLDALRANRESEDQIPVLVLTGDPTAQAKRRALAAGATDLLAKPFDTSEVSMRIRNLLQARFLRLEIQEQNHLLEERVRQRTGELENALSDLQAAQRQAVQQERLSAFGEMAGGVVHDFSNALMSVIGYSEMLLTNATARADDATALEYLRIINTAGRDGAHVVSRLRDFYRPRDAADLFEPLDLSEIVLQSIALATPRCAKREIDKTVSFQTEFDGNNTATGIGAELREVLTNLIFNALDAIPAAGVITLRTRQTDSEAIIEVIDTGTGMSPEVKERCLEPFFTTKGDDGTGLGLAMVFGIIKRHQGTLEIESEPGKGTTVRIRLPACAPLVETKQNEAPSPIQVGRAHHPLCVQVLCAFVFALLAFIFCAPHSAQAVTKTWDAGGATGDWSGADNWNANGVPGAADDVLFDNTGQSPLEDIFLNANQSINSLTINLTVASNQNWNLGAANSATAFTLTLATGNISVLSTSGTGTYVIGATIGTGIMTLATSDTGFTFDNSRTNGGILQIDAIISGASNTVTKTGPGTVFLSGANTFTGATTINSGTLTAAASSGSALGSTSAITVNSGGTLLLGANNQISDTTPVTLGGGTFAKGDFSEGSTSTAGAGALTLSATGSHLDFGTGTVGTLTFASFTPGSYTLTIDNWTSGTTDRLIFASDQSANLSSFNFTGYTSATEVSLGGGYYEVTPTAVPEPATYFAGALALGVLGYHQRRRLAERLRRAIRI